METFNIIAFLSGVGVTTAAFTYFDSKNAKRLKQRGAELRHQIRLNHEMDLRNAELALQLREQSKTHLATISQRNDLREDLNNAEQLAESRRQDIIKLNQSFQEWQKIHKQEAAEQAERIQQLKNERDELAQWKENKLQIKRKYYARKKGA